MKKLLLVVVSLASLAIAGTASAAVTTLHLTEKQTFQHYVDNGTKGESAGDIRTVGVFYLIFAGAAAFFVLKFLLRVLSRAS